MSKAVMISIQPKWAAKIANGEKTIEVRKTRPKLDTPFKCYIYCTKGQLLYEDFPDGTESRKIKLAPYSYTGQSHSLNGRVIGEFECDEILKYVSEFWDDNVQEEISEVVEPTDDFENGENSYYLIATNGEDNQLCKDACLTWDELRDYIGQGINYFYGWHISDLVIYDKPKELSEFKHQNRCYKESSIEHIGCWEGICEFYDLGECDGRCSSLTRPPQSWCYVEA